MASFVPIPYTYVPTAPRSKSTAAHRKSAPEQSSSLDQLQRSKPSSVAFDDLRLPAPTAANGHGGYRSGNQAGSDTFYDGSDDDDLPTIEVILHTTLQKKVFTTAGSSPDNTALQVEELASERGGSIEHSKPASSYHSGNRATPINLLGNDDSSASEAEVDGVGVAAECAMPDTGLFDGPETNVDSTTLAPPSPEEWHDIDDFLETAPRLKLTEVGASISNSMRPYSPVSCLSNEDDRISKKGLYTHRARCEATECHSAHPRSPPPRRSRASPENSFSQERQQQEVEQEEEADNDGKGQQQVNDVAARVTADRSGATLPDGSPRLAEQLQLLPPCVTSSDSSHEGPGRPRVGESDGDFDKGSDSDDTNRKPRRSKRKRPFSSSESLMHKKRKLELKRRSTCLFKLRSKSRRRSTKSYPSLEQSLRVDAVTSIESRLPSPAPSAPQAVGTKMLSDCCNLGRSSENILPRLIEATFRPHSPQSFSFTAMIRDGYDGQGVSFSQLARLVESIGHVGNIDDFTIKPIEQNSFLVTGFSRQTLPQPSASATAVSAVLGAGTIRKDEPRIRASESNAADAGALVSQVCELSCSDDESNLSDSHPDPSRADDGRLDKDGQRRSKKHDRWSELDQHLLLAYKKEAKSWSWIFRKFPGRTPAAVRVRWNMIRSRAT